MPVGPAAAFMAVMMAVGDGKGDKDKYERNMSGC